MSMKVYWAVPIIASILVLGVSGFQQAHALTIVISDQASCEGPVGGSWNGANNFCTVSGNILILDGTTWEVVPGITLIFDDTTLVANFGTFKNFGSTVSEGIFSNNGLIEHNSGAKMDNTGTLYINEDGILENNSKFQNFGNVNILKGTIHNNAAAEIINKGGAHFFNDGLVVNDAGATIHNLVFARETKNEGILNNFGLYINDGTDELFDGGTINNKATGTVQNNGQMTVKDDGTVNNDGMIENFGDFDDLPGATINNNDGGVFTNKAGGSMFGDGVFNNFDGALFINFGVVTKNDGILNNFGTFANHDYTELFDGGTINNKATGITENNGVIDVKDDGTVNNDGILNVNDGGFLNALPGGIVNNNDGGLISVKANALFFNDNIFNNYFGATLHIEPFGIASKNAGITNNFGSIIIDGIMNLFDGGTLNNNDGGTVQNNGEIIIEKTGTINNNKNAELINNESLTVIGILKNDGVFKNTGTLIVIPPDGELGDKIIICHKGKNTLSINPDSAEDHLLHNDSTGPCENPKKDKKDGEDKPKKVKKSKKK